MCKGVGVWGAHVLMHKRCGVHMGIHTHAQWGCVGDCVQVGDLSVWPGLAQATDQRWAVDQGLGTPVIDYNTTFRLCGP